MLRNQPEKTAAIVTTVGSLLLSLLLGLVFPLVTDEAYYLDWSRSADWPSLGFFDHPPVVSWLGVFGRFYSGVFAGRVLVWISSLVTAYVTFCLSRRLLPKRPLYPTAIAASSVAGIASGFLLTPDVGLSLAWALALHEAFVAITHNPKRWVTAGVVTGFGILSKYTMLLIGPVFLLALIFEARKQLRSIWPYLGGIACLLILLPHLYWQSSHGWVTFKFQFRHGFSISQSQYSNSSLPRAIDADKNSSAYQAKERLYVAMLNTPGFGEAVLKPKPEKSALERTWTYVGDYLGGVAGLWGGYSIAALVFFLKGRFRQKEKSKNTESPHGSYLLKVSVIFPLVFFTLLCPFTKIEANWPAMHMVGLALWVSWANPPRPMTLCVVFLTHVALFASLGIILVKPEILGSARRNRLLLESRGYMAIGDWAESNFQGDVLGVDSYQLKSSIRFYAPSVSVVQWPGFTRDSEYTRGRKEDLSLENKIMNQDKFSVISAVSKPKTIAGYDVTQYRGIRVCPDGSVGIFSEKETSLPCQKGLREWWVIDYARQKP